MVASQSGGLLAGGDAVSGPLEQNKRSVVHIGERRLLALQSSSFENILRHEIGHCNGWPGDHRGARTWREAERDKGAR